MADESPWRFWTPYLHSSSSSSSSSSSASNVYRSTHHSQSLLSGLGALRSRGILFDVVLRVEGKPLPAHRVILAASCEYFRGMFTGGFREMDQEEVRIRGISYDAMRRILNFIYTSEMEIGLSSVEEILSTACQLQIPEVIGFCCDFLSARVDPENILDVYRLADLFSLGGLSDWLDWLVLNNLASFSQTEAYRRMPLEKVFALLSSNRLWVGSEIEVYEGVRRYFFSPEQLEAGEYVTFDGSDQLLETVRFPLMDVGNLRSIHDDLGPGPLKEMVAAALDYHRNEALQPALQSPRTRLRSDLRCVVRFGGMHTFRSGTLSSQAWFLNPYLQVWRYLTPVSAPLLSGQGVAVYNDFVYIIGGEKDIRRMEEHCWRYDPRHNRWFQIRPLQQPRRDLAVCVVGEHIYAVAGRDSHGGVREVERYDPRRNAWEYAAPLREDVYAHAGAASEGKMYVACGIRGEELLKELRRYDPAADRWEDLPDSPSRRAWHGMAAATGKLYVVGGSTNEMDGLKDVLEVDCYSPSSSQWTTVTPLPSGHSFPAVAALDHHIYVLGGHASRDRTGDVHVYCAEQDLWEQGPPFEDGALGVAACAVTLPWPVCVDNKSSWTRSGGGGSGGEGHPDPAPEGDGAEGPRDK